MSGVHENQGPRFERNYIIAKGQKCDEHGASFQSGIAENTLHAHHKARLHKMKVYNTPPVSLTVEVLLIQIVLYFDH